MIFQNRKHRVAIRVYFWVVTRWEKLCITHLGFADNLLLFCRGDLISIMLLFNCFTVFSKASGLIANADKSSLYFGGVTTSEQDSILQALIELGFTKCTLPFKYVGIPLTSKKTMITQYKPFLDKMLIKVKSWTSKYLSYVDRVQLIKTILFFIQIYWSQDIYPPKKVVKQTACICRFFRWSWGLDTSKKALIV